MSFKIGRFFYLITSYILGAFFFVSGIVGIILPWSPHLKQAIAQFILENTLVLSLFGLGFALIGLSIVIYALLSSRRRYTQIRTGAFSLVLDQNVIQNYLEAYWLENFPESHVSFNLAIKKNSIQIVADLPYVPEADQKIFLEKVRNDFSELFGRIIGYPNEVHLIASFSGGKSASKVAVDS